MKPSILPGVMEAVANARGRTRAVSQSRAYLAVQARPLLGHLLVSARVVTLITRQHVTAVVKGVSVLGLRGAKSARLYKTESVVLFHSAKPQVFSIRMRGCCCRGWFIPIMLLLLSIC